MLAELNAPDASAEAARVAEELLAQGALSIGDAAKFSALSRSELYQLMTSGALVFVKHGKRRLIPKKALIKLLAEGLRGGKN